jgi:hypothetical protein
MIIDDSQDFRNLYLSILTLLVTISDYLLTQILNYDVQQHYQVLRLSQGTLTLTRKLLLGLGNT